MTKSPHFLKADAVKNTIERYSDRLKTDCPALAVGADDEDSKRLWHMPDKFFPSELTATPVKRKKVKATKKRGPKDSTDLASKLDALEKKEGEGDDEEDDEEAAASAAKKKKLKVDGEEGEEDEDDDEEVDGDEEEEEEMGGNDYEQNYFDNGEDEANSSENNLDEGGTY